MRKINIFISSVQTFGEVGGEVSGEVSGEVLKVILVLEGEMM